MKVDFNRFKEDYDVELVVLSRDRADLLYKRTDSFLRDYHLFYSGEGYDEHEYHATKMTEVPRGLHGLSVVRNYVLDTLPNKIVIFVDDDINIIYWVHSTRAVRMSPQQVRLMWVNLVVHALDQGVEAFGISELDSRKSSPLVPFIQRAVFGTVFGVVGREHKFDERNVLKTDYDFCLQKIRDTRMIHKDLRYFAVADKDAGRGGNMSFRTPNRRYDEIKRLQRWWGDDVIVPGKAKVVETLTVKIP